MIFTPGYFTLSKCYKSFHAAYWKANIIYVLFQLDIHFYQITLGHCHTWSHMEVTVYILNVNYIEL